jgi:radical SAM superfamily enzyme YgiQ (UPF0313 family)
MNITFIKPDFFAACEKHKAMEPLGLSLLIALTPERYDIKVIDERVCSPDFETLETDLAMISVDTYTTRRAYEIADLLRLRGIPVVMGGFHPTLMPQECLQHADAIAIGDVELIWLDILADALHHSLKKIYKQTDGRELSQLLFAHERFQNEKYAPVTPVMLSRGCVNHCNFCTVNAFYQGMQIYRPVAEVIREIEALDGSDFFLIDDNPFADTVIAKEFLRELHQSGKRWWANACTDVCYDSEMLHLLGQSGCEGVMIGFESIIESNIRDFGKIHNLKNSDYRDIIRRYQSEGIKVLGLFIFGSDGDHPDVFQRTLDFALESDLNDAYFHVLTPMPGTSVYDDLCREQRMLTPNWWLSKDYRFADVVFKPKHMSPEELSEGCKAVSGVFTEQHKREGGLLLPY